MQITNGIAASLFHKGKKVEESADGFLGRFRPDTTVTLVIDANDVAGFTMDGRKNVRLMNAEAGGSYKLPIVIFRTNAGTAYAAYPANTLRLVETQAGGRTIIRRVTLASQDGDFFLAHDVAYDVRCYRGERGGVTCPALRETWPQMNSLLSEIWLSRESELAPESEYRDESEPTADGLAAGNGKVLWWSAGQGMGAIVTPEGVARVHWYAVEPRPRRRYLVPGELVQYDRLERPETRRGTSFEWQAVSVHPSGK